MRDYSTREVADIAGLPDVQVRRWARAGFIAARKDSAGRWRYSFQDIALLRAARKLLDAEVSLKRVTRTLRLLQEQLPAGRPLSAVRLVLTGRRVVVKDRLSSWEPESRQGTLDFELRSLGLPVARELPAANEAAAEEGDAERHYQAALDLELAGQVDAARRAYQAALKLDPQLNSARINLGRLLHSAKRVAEAEALYRAALAQDPHNAHAAFNLAVALEDQGQMDAAVGAYRNTLAIDDDYADAHFNLSRLFEARGEQQAALRHLSRFKRLQLRD